MGWLVVVQTPSKVLVVVIRSRITCSYVPLERAETPVSLTSVLIDFCRYPGVTQGCGLFIPQPQFGVGKKMDDAGTAACLLVTECRSSKGRLEVGEGGCCP